MGIWMLMGCMVGGDAAIEGQIVAVREACAWPNLTLLPGGDIVALIFNRPYHGSGPGDVECWATADNGRTWERRAVAAARPDPDSNRMNVAAGLAPSGALVAVVSGYHSLSAGGPHVDRILSAQVCRSSDGGRTWIRTSDLPDSPDGLRLIPFGDIAVGGDGHARVFAYTAGRRWAAYMLTSRDDGHRFDSPVELGEGLNECAPLHLGGGRWIAAVRTGTSQDLHLLRSDDDGSSWRDDGPVTQANQHPGHLLRLRDGRILMTYGDRRPAQPGIEAVLSADEGRTWGEPLRLLALPMVDLGYPSCVELPDGRVLTAYYAQRGPGCDGYHMGTVTWRPPEIAAP